MNPYAPEGWWTAVDALRGRCVVVISRDGGVDLAHHDAGVQLAALMGRWGGVRRTPVVTVLEGEHQAVLMVRGSGEGPSIRHHRTTRHALAETRPARLAPAQGSVLSSGAATPTLVLNSSVDEEGRHTPNNVGSPRSG